MATNDHCGRNYRIFEKMFPSLAAGVTHYGPLDTKTIRMETTAHVYLVFTYIAENEWSLQTMKQYCSSNRNRQ